MRAWPLAALAVVLVTGVTTSQLACTDTQQVRTDARSTGELPKARAQRSPTTSESADEAAPNAANERIVRIEVAAEAIAVAPANADAPLAPLYAALATRAQSDSGLYLSTPLHCAASAIATLGDSKKPSLRVRRFIASTCGAFAADVDAVYWSTDASPGAELSDLAEGFAPALASRLSAIRFSGPSDVGVGAALSGARFVVVVVKAKRFATLTPETDRYRLALTPDAPLFVRLADADVLSTGESGQTVHCTEALGGRGSDDHALVVSCPPAPGPRWLIAGVQPNNWLVGQPLGAMRLGDSGRVYTRRLPSAPETPNGFSALVGRARAEASPSLPPLTLAASSPAIDENAATLLALLEQGVLPTDAQLATVLKWWLSGAALNEPSDMGYVGWAVAQKSDEPGELWGTVLEFPDTQSVVLTRDTDRLVVSSVLSVSDQVQGVVYGTYATRDDDALYARVDRQLNVERLRHGGKWSVWTDGAPKLDDARASFGDDAAKRSELVRLATAHGDAQTQWLVLEAAQVNLLTVPEALATAQNAAVAFFVTRGDNRDTGDAGVQVWVAYRGETP